MTRDRRLALRRRVHDLLEDSHATGRAARLVHRGLVAVVLLSVAGIVLETVPAYAARYPLLWDALEALAVVVFTAEFALRLWSAPDHPNAPAGALAARLAYLGSWPALVDLAAVLPIYLSLFVAADLKMMLLLRLLRFFKLARYSPGMRSLLAALEVEKRALGATGVILLGLVLVTASAMHWLEHEAQPDKLGSIPEAMWWAVVTLTTVGYGDVVPVTAAGKVLAGLTTLLGLMMLALPVGIVATAFAQEIHKREFVVTWGMIAKVPLFASLDAAEIAEVMRYLRADEVAAGARVFRKGESAHAIYFVVSGEVEVEIAPPVRLGPGAFFGESGALRGTPRSASVRACAPTRLLVLERMDLQVLMDRTPGVARRIEAVIAARGG